MTANRNQKWEDITPESLGAQLRSLPELEVPGALEAKILSGIPNSPTGSRGHGLQWWPRVWGLGIATAAILILALMFVSDSGPSVSSHTFIADLNDRPAHHVLSDQNSLLIEDTNAVTSAGQK
ncbi:MAG: hypothetical protein JSU70_21220 [Phycisphaerales bacterium]|nr:MAG: hypothetical protein JSU70_21220 [Phycisphaerales bacterium]